MPNDKPLIPKPIKIKNAHSVKAKYDPDQLIDLRAKISAWAIELGFQEIGISDINLGEHRNHLKRWLDRHFNGEMAYMSQNLDKRLYPNQLVPNTIRVISARFNYLSDQKPLAKRLQLRKHAYISRYALGRDYHKLMRKRLAKLAGKIEQEIGGFGYRAFVDSAPVLEKALAEKGGLGWIGKNTLLINRAAGSWFFLGELYTDLPLPLDKPQSEHCGTCKACIDICPTQAIVAPFQLDARKCISYLTIENKGKIPISHRRAIGNRVFGCDDCQIICPWNKFARFTKEDDFSPRHDLDQISLLALFNWDEATFLKNTEGSAIRRAGYEGWQRNLAVGLGNAPHDPLVVSTLKKRLNTCSPMVKEHIDWAIYNLELKVNANQP